MEWIAVVMFVAVCATLLVGYPVAFTLAGVALWFAGLGVVLGALSSGDLLDIASRVYGTMTNVTLMAVPLFVFMGVMLERSKLAEQLLQTMAALFGRVRGGLLASVVVVGALLAASTGIVGATVVAMGLISLPTLLERGVSPRLASGAICASGTLGQVIPPSIVLVLLGDVLSAAYQQAQLRSGVWSVETVSVGDLFAGALIPGLVLVVCYVAYVLFAAQRAAWRGEGDVATADAP
ncbi:MAG: TRAP transporter large permease subunit, partial [Algiphilus sp.]